MVNSSLITGPLGQEVLTGAAHSHLKPYQLYSVSR